MPQRFTPSPSGPKDPNDLNRFTLTDYVYDREDDEFSTPALVAGSKEERPSSWGMALQGDLSNIRGSMISPSRKEEVEKERQEIMLSPTTSSRTYGPRHQMMKPSLPAIPASTTAAAASLINSHSRPDLDDRTYTSKTERDMAMRRLPSSPIIDNNLTSPSSSSYLRPLPEIPTSSTMASSSSSSNLTQSKSSSGMIIPPIIQLPATPPKIHRGTSFNNTSTFPIESVQSSRTDFSAQQPQMPASTAYRPAIQTYGSSSDIGESSSNQLGTELEVIPSLSRSYRPSRMSGMSGISGVSKDDMNVDMELGEKKDYGIKNVTFSNDLPKGRSNSNWIKKWVSHSILTLYKGRGRECMEAWRGGISVEEPS